MEVPTEHPFHDDTAAVTHTGDVTSRMRGVTREGTQAGGDEGRAVTFPHTDTARRRPPITSPEYVHYRSCVALEGGSRAGVGGDHHQLCGPHPTPGPGGHRAGPRASAATAAAAAAVADNPRDG